MLSAWLLSVRISGIKRRCAMDSMAVIPESTYDVFLSYSSADDDVVARIVAKLVDAGLKLFLDQRNLLIGNTLASNA